MSTAGVVVSAERPARWIQRRPGPGSELLDPLVAAVVDDRRGRGSGLDRSPLTRRLLDLYSVWPTRAPIRSARTPSSLRPFSADIRPSDPSGAVFTAGRLVRRPSLRADARRPAVSRNGVLRPRNELVASGDRSSLDAIRQRSPGREPGRAGRQLRSARRRRDDRSMSPAVAPPHPRAACRRSEVLLERALRRWRRRTDGDVTSEPGRSRFMAPRRGPTRSCFPVSPLPSSPVVSSGTC